MNNVENIEKDSNINTLESEKIINIKKYQSFNESNLMTLPFISLKRARVQEIKRKWVRDGQEIGLTVRGAKYGCPTIYELDVIMALLRIQSKNMDNKIVIASKTKLDENGDVLERTNKVTNLPKIINFTYRALAKEMGLKGWGKATKKRLEDSIKCLNECTVYSSLAIRDQTQEQYIVEFNGLESSRILKNYRAYSIHNYKIMGKDLLSPKDIIEAQSIEIDDFFYNNLTNNFFKIYDYETYMKLKMGISKKLLLILTQWSHGSEKYITLHTLFDYTGLDYETEKEEKYNYAQLKKALNELVEVGFIQDFKATMQGVNFVFNITKKEKEKGLDKYTNNNDIVGRLREIGIEYEDINKYCRLDTMSYIAGLLRYVDYRHKKGWVKDLKKFTLKGLPFERYDVEEFMV